MDLVVAMEIIEHLDSPPAFLSGCARALKPSGAIFLTTPNRVSAGRYLNEIISIIPRRKKKGIVHGKDLFGGL